MKTRKVGIIGAGAAGICSAKYLLASGLDVTLFETGSMIGGLWVYDNDNDRSSAYASLHINSEKRNTQFHDFPFAADVQEFPSHEDMADYLGSYARNFGVAERIRFNSKVTRVTPSVDEGGALRWVIEVNDGAERHEFDSVIVAAGHLTEHVMPPFANDFRGEIMHSHYYRVPTPFAGKRVLVIGSGNSGCDITADVSAYASRTVMAARSPELIVPKIFMGRPVTQITGQFEKPWLPSGLPRLARKVITHLSHGPMENFGLRTPKGRTHPTSHATLINLLAYRRAFAKPGVESASGATIRFADGSSEEFDTVICATGYDIRFPYLDEAIAKVERGGIELFKRIVPPGWPGLYFVGYFNTAGSSNLRMFEGQSRWIAKVETGECALPSRSEMLADVAATDAYYENHYPGGPRYALEIEPLRYTRELNAEARRGAKRRRRVVTKGQEMSRSIEDFVPRLRNYPSGRRVTNPSLVSQR
ncbi:NAD(P)-binding domain-containing protein [Leifsonia bigeumensis]|uniref:NAD(P)-binding domain-containing protein n=1 Tax=Leifsonella bigeumensis TaxID=433643 RepID=A0ABP7F8R0_9MICO